MSETWQDNLERAQGDGRITTHDADEVRTFASFLTETEGLPKTGGTEDEVWARRIAYARHYPDDFERAFPDLYRKTFERAFPDLYRKTVERADLAIPDPSPAALDRTGES